MLELFEELANQVNSKCTYGKVEGAEVIRCDSREDGRGSVGRCGGGENGWMLFWIGER